MCPSHVAWLPITGERDEERRAPAAHMPLDLGGGALGHADVEHRFGRIPVLQPDKRMDQRESNAQAAVWGLKSALRHEATRDALDATPIPRGEIVRARSDAARSRQRRSTRMRRRRCRAAHYLKRKLDRTACRLRPR